MGNVLQLAYTDIGQGAPLLLLHAFPLTRAMWQPQITALQATHRLIVPDLRGFGATAAPPGAYMMAQFAADLIALLDQLELPQVALGGLSMGGYIAFELLRQAPERIAALILADTRPGTDTTEGQARREANAQIAETQGAAAIAELMIPNLVAPSATAELRTTLRGLILGNSPTGIAGALRGMAQRPDSTPDLAAIRVPTLIVVGEHDTLTPPSEAAAMHAAIAASTLVTIPAAGHLPNLEQPAAFTNALQQFLARL